MAKRYVRAPGPVAKIIEQGYGSPAGGGVMFFRVGAQTTGHSKDWVDLLEAVAKIEYGEFNGVDVTAMLGFHGDAGYLALVEFGREYSPVLYLHFSSLGGAGPYGQSIAKLFVGDKRAIAEYLDGIKVEFGIAPDEVEWDPSRRCLRLWWD